MGIEGNGSERAMLFRSFHRLQNPASDEIVKPQKDPLDQKDHLFLPDGEPPVDPPDPQPRDGSADRGAAEIGFFLSASGGGFDSV